MSTTVYANVYRSLNGAMGSIWETQELADQMAGRDRIACVPIDVPGNLDEGLRGYVLRGGKISFSGKGE